MALRQVFAFPYWYNLHHIPWKIQISLLDSWHNLFWHLCWNNDFVWLWVQWQQYQFHVNCLFLEMDHCRQRNFGVFLLVPYSFQQYSVLSSQLTMLKRGLVPLFCWAAPAFAPFSDQIKMKTWNWRQVKIFKSKKSPRVKRTRSMKSLQWRVKRIESKQSL